MEIKCLNCCQPIGVEDSNIGMSFCCDNCRGENFIDYFGTPPKAVYFKVKKENGEIITYGQCKNEECDGHCVDNSVFRAKVAMPGVEPTKQISGSTDCPECGTPGRLMLTTIPSQ